MHAPMYPLPHSLRGRNDSERAPRKGNLSYAGRASGVKNKMTRSAWKRWMSNGLTAVCFASTSTTHVMPSSVCMHRGDTHSRHRRHLSPYIVVQPLGSSIRLCTAHVCSKLSLGASSLEHRVPD